MTALRELRIHGELVARQSTEAPEPAHLTRDHAAGLFLPLPDALDERLAAEVDAALARGVQLALDHHLRGDARHGRCPAATACRSPRMRWWRISASMIVSWKACPMCSVPVTLGGGMTME